MFKRAKKPVYTSVKALLKKLLLDGEMGPRINALVFEVNDLVIHTMQFMRLYTLQEYSKGNPMPRIDALFIAQCIRTLGTAKWRIRKDSAADRFALAEKLRHFYEDVYQPLLDHEKTDLRGKSCLVAYISLEIKTAYCVSVQQRFTSQFFRFVKLTSGDITKDRSALHCFKHNVLRLAETDPIFSK